MSKIQLWFEDCIKIENEFWYASGRVNGLFKSGITNGETELVGLFEGESADRWRLFSGMVRQGNKLFFIPYTASRLFVYDLDAKRMEPVILNSVEPQYLLCCAVHDEKILMIHANKDSFLVYDTVSSEVCMLDGYRKRFGITGRCVEEGILKRGKFYTGCEKNNRMLIVDLENMRLESVKIGIDNTGYKMIGEKSEYLLACDEKENVYKIDLSGKILEKMTCLERVNMRDDYNNKIIIMNDDLYVFSFTENKIKRINMQTAQMAEIDIMEYEDSSYCVPLKRHWGAVKKLDQEILFVSNADLRVRILDQSLNVQEVVFDIEMNTLRKAWEREGIKYKNDCCEDLFVSLESYLNKILTSDIAVRKTGCSRCGKTIYENV